MIHSDINVRFDYQSVTFGVEATQITFLLVVYFRDTRRVKQVSNLLPFDFAE